MREIDDRLIDQGIDVPARSMRMGLELSKELDITIAISSRDAISVLISEYFRLVYGQENLVVGPVHVGALMLRDIFFEVKVPMIFGRVQLEPWTCVDDLSKQHLELFHAFDSRDFEIGTDQLMDIFNFGLFASDSSRKLKPESANLILIAREQMESACRTLRGSFSKRVAIQGACYAVETVGKAVLVQKAAYSDEQLRKLGHNLGLIRREVEGVAPDIDHALLGESVALLPNVISERYNFEGLNRRRIGEVIRHSQFAIAEFARSLNKSPALEVADWKRSFPSVASDLSTSKRP